MWLCHPQYYSRLDLIWATVLLSAIGVLWLGPRTRRSAHMLLLVAWHTMALVQVRLMACGVVMYAVCCGTEVEEHLAHWGSAFLLRRLLPLLVGTVIIVWRFRATNGPRNPRIPSFCMATTLVTITGDLLALLLLFCPHV